MDKRKWRIWRGIIAFVLVGVLVLSNVLLPDSRAFADENGMDLQSASECEASLEYPKENTAKETVVEETAVEETIIEETIIEETAVKETVSRETVVEETEPEETAVKETADKATEELNETKTQSLETEFETSETKSSENDEAEPEMVSLTVYIPSYYKNGAYVNALESFSYAAYPAPLQDGEDKELHAYQCEYTFDELCAQGITAIKVEVYQGGVLYFKPVLKSSYQWRRLTYNSNRISVDFEADAEGIYTIPSIDSGSWQSLNMEAEFLYAFRFDIDAEHARVLSNGEDVTQKNITMTFGETQLGKNLCFTVEPQEGYLIKNIDTDSKDVDIRQITDTTYEISLGGSAMKDCTTVYIMIVKAKECTFTLDVGRRELTLP